MPDYTSRLVVRPSGYREYHIERRGVKIADCGSMAHATFLVHVLNAATHDQIMAALDESSTAYERSAA